MYFGVVVGAVKKTISFYMMVQFFFHFSSSWFKREKSSSFLLLFSVNSLMKLEFYILEILTAFSLAPSGSCFLRDTDETLVLVLC